MKLRRSLPCVLAQLMALAGCSDDADLSQVDDPATVDCRCRLATQFENLALCVSPSTALSGARAYSSSWSAATGMPVCEPYREPQPVPVADWTTVQVSSACTGAAQLCVTVKAGDGDAPSAEDCELTRYCSDFAYAMPDEVVSLPPISGWTATPACALRQEQLGAYLEFEVESAQLGCEPGERQLRRVSVCPSRCEDEPTGPGCEVCGRGDVTTTF